MAITDGPGTYILLLALHGDSLIQIGRLGALPFRAGYYLYVGSALNGLRQRLARHLRATKRLHWHIDYLLQRAQVVEVWYHLGPERYECAWARALAQLPTLSPCDKPFGASDCSCRTHLFYSAERPSWEQYRSIIHSLDGSERPC